MELANEGKVTLKAVFDVDTSELKKIDKEVEKSTRKSKITIDEWAKQNGMTVEQAKQHIDSLAREYERQGSLIRNAYRKVYSELGVISESQRKKLKKEKESFKEMGESAEDTADYIRELSEEENKAASAAENLVDNAKSVSNQTEKQGKASKEAAKKTKSYGNENKEAAAKTKSLSDETDKAKKTAKKFGAAIKEAGNLAGKAAKGGLNASLKAFQGLANFSASTFRATAMGVATGLTTVATATTGLIGMGTAYNAEIEQYRVSFETMTGSAEKAFEIVDSLKKTAAETPFELTDLSQVTQLLINYGLSADDAIDKMSMLGDISQGNSEKLQRIAVAYGQMSSAGKVYLEDVKQMIEAGFNPLQEIADSTGETMESLYKRIETGTISVDEITESMERSTSEGGKYFNSMLKQSKTFSGQLSTLRDNFKSFTGVIAEAATDSKINDFFPMLNESLSNLEDALTSGGFKQMSSVLGKELSKFISMGLSYVPDLMDLGTEIMESIVDGFLSDESSLEKSTQKIFEKLPAFIKTNMDTGFKVGTELIKLIANGINDNTSEISGAVTQMIASFVGFFETNAPLVKEAATSLVNALSEGITKDSDKISSSVFSILTLIPQFIAENIDTISNVVVSFIQNISNGIKQNKDLLKESASTIVNALSDGLADLIEIGLDIVTDLIDIITDAIEKNETAFRDTISRVIGALVNFITKNIQPFVNAAITIIRAFVGGLKDDGNIRLISEAIVDIITLFGQVISENLPAFLGAALTIITQIADGLKSQSASEKLTEALTVILNSIVDAVEKNVDLLSDAAISIISFIMDDLLSPENLNKIIDGASEFIDKINEELLSDENVDKMLETGGEIVAKIVAGIGRAILNIDWSELIGTLPDLFNFIIDPNEYIKNLAQRKTLEAIIPDDNSGVVSGAIDAGGLNFDVSSIPMLERFKAAQSVLESDITRSVTNNSTIDNSTKATYNTTNYNNFEVRNDQDIKWLGEMLQSDADSNKKGRGY